MVDHSELRTFRDAVNEALDDALGADESVVVFGEDVADPEGGGVMTVTQGLSSKYGERVRSTPISEQAIAGAAVGAAIAGMRPVAEIMLMNFITVAMDQLVNHAAKLRYMSGGQTAVPLTIRTMTGAGGGFGAQHSEMLEALLAHIPGLKVVAASNPYDAKGLLRACIADDDPCIFIEHLQLYYGGGRTVLPDAQTVIPLGTAAVRREGDDVTVISYSKQVNDVERVAERLGGEGIGVEVVDLRTIAPFDEETVLRSVAKTRRAVVVHEAVRTCGIGAEISSRIHEELWAELAGPVGRVTSLSCPVPFAPTLEKAYLVDEAAIEEGIRSVLKYG
jgi:pyruvate/2-oxoglutarate/acetoin dehydrogenase E1 component